MWNMRSREFFRLSWLRIYSGYKKSSRAGMRETAD